MKIVLKQRKWLDRFHCCLVGLVIAGGVPLALVLAPSKMEAAKNDELVVTGSYVPLQTEPGALGSAIAHLESGDRVTEYGRQGNWVKVVVEETMELGWVKADSERLVTKRSPGGPLRFGFNKTAVVNRCLHVRFTNFEPGGDRIVFDVAELYVENRCERDVVELELNFVLVNFRGDTTSYSVIATSRLLKRAPIRVGKFFARKIHFKNYGKRYDAWSLSVVRFKFGA